MVRKREVYVVNFELRALERKNYDAVIKLRQAYERRLSDILVDGNRLKKFDVGDVRVATFAILSMLTGVCTWYRPSGRLSKDPIVAVHQKLVIDGVMRSAMAPPQRRRHRMRSA